MKKLLIGLGILAVIVVILVVSLGRKKVSGEGVYAEKVSRGDVVTVVTGTGVIQPRTKVNISSEVYGQIIELPVKEGQTAQKGQLLVRIDPKRYQDEVDRLEANVRMSRTAIEAQEANLRNLEIDQRRAHELNEQEILAQSDLERADLAVTTGRIQLKSLKESVAQAEASLSRARQELSKTTIYAPMAGKVTQLSSEVGEQVIIGTTNIPGSVIMVISDMSEILAEVNVDETEIVQLKPGQTAKVTADAVEKTTYEGRVTEIGNTAIRQGDVNVFGVKILLTSPDERLRPGMTAKAKIEVERQRDVLRVPIQAVTARERKQLNEERKAAGKSKSAAAGATKDEKGAKGATEKGEAEKSAAASEAAAKGEAAKGEAAGTSGKVETAGGPAGASSSEPARAEAAKGEGEAGGASGGATAAKDGAGSAAGKPGEEGAATAGAKGATGAADEKAAGASAPAATAGGDKPGADAKAGDEREELEVVYVIEKDLVHAVQVKTGASDETYVEIKDGLKEGENVVKGPYRILRRLKVGDRVVVKDERETADEAEKANNGSQSESYD